MKAICRVCELIDNDTTLKEVEYCELCKANICNECKPNLLKRGKAAIKYKQTAFNKAYTKYRLHSKHLSNGSTKGE